MADSSSEHSIKTMSGWLLASATLMLVLQWNQVHAEAAAAAAAGLSEVWSEADGMRMKYSTNHGDLLSSKGSEMSLSSDQRHHQLEPAGNGDESATAVEGGGEGGAESQGEESGERAAKGAAGEDGNEQADSRKTEKVVPAHPTAGRVHSYSSLAGPSGRAHNQFRSSASSRSTSEAPSSGYDSSGSAPEDQMVNDNGEATATGGDGEQSSADAAAAADEPPAGEAPVGKFRAPGRHFKEAVKMVGSHKQETKAENEGGADSEAGDSKDEGEEKSSAPEETPTGRTRSGGADEADDSADFNSAQGGSGGGDGSWGAAFERQATSGKRAQAQEESDYGRPFEGSAAGANLDNESPLSMAGSPLELPEQQMFRPATPRNQMPGAGSFGAGEENETDEQMPLSNFRAASPSAGPMFYEGSAQSSRALPSAGNSHKERSQQSQAASAGKRPQSQQSAAVNKQAYKQLSYFKSVPDQPQRAGAGPSPRYPSAARNSAAPADSSPDSVRDNFISPGHYPGSMPHLTQAASEIAQSKSSVARTPEAASVTTSGETLPAAAAKGELTKASSQQVTDEQAPVSSDTNNQQQRGATTTAKQPAAAAVDADQQSQAAESKEVVSVLTVTPSPEAQQESQQIMAPILVTTTTMAPLLPTPAASSTTTPAPSSTPGTATTSQAPALKRFKFRKYR